MDAALRAFVREAMIERDGRAQTARRLAAQTGVSVATIYRVAQVGGTRRRRAGRADYREWARAVVRLAHEAPQPVPLDVALRAAVAGGDLPPEAAEMPISTLHRLAREAGLSGRRRRVSRLSAEWPWQAVQIDASTSMHVAVRRDGALGLHRRPLPASGYKNKPLGADRLRVIIYSAWDLCTGWIRSRYVVSRGENALDAMEFLCWVCAASSDRRIVGHGVPDDLWTDQGPMFKGAMTRDLIERLDISLVTGAPYAKERMGGVERTHRTRWQRFERALFLAPGLAGPFDVEALNARLAEYELAENGRRPSRTPVDGRRVSRTAAWMALTARRPPDRPLRRLPDQPLETLARAARRRIDQAGLIRWGGETFEAPAGWHDRWVVARRAAIGAGDLTIEDEQTGERRTAARWSRRPYGEIRTGPRTETERLRDEAPAAGADVYAPPSAPPSVVPLPPRTAPSAPLENPLAETRLDLRAAWRVFSAIYPHPLSASQRARVETQFVGGGLRREAVVDLARELLAAGSRYAAI